MIKGLEVGCKKVHLSHLQFADDPLILMTAGVGYLQQVKKILLSFQSFLGLAINYNKLGLIVIEKKDQWADSAAQMLDCMLVQLPITYLGVPLGANMRRFSLWQCIIEKIQNRLGSWKTGCISRAGRLVLIKAILNSLPLTISHSLKSQ